jgi:hypothetical protein
MRRYLAASALLFLAACATQQPTAPSPAEQPPPPQQARGRILGLTAEELVQRFGTPALQIREGDSWKLQFRSRQCVLDAYLYPPAPGRTPYRVTYVETRTPSLGAIDQALCIASFPAP